MAMRGTPSALAALTGSSRLRRVLAAYALYGFIEFYAWLVIVLWSFERGGAALAGTAAVVQLIPAALLGPVGAGVFGAVGTLVIVGIWAGVFPSLRKVDTLEG